MTEVYPLIDAHCHLDDVAFDADREAVSAAGQAAGVVGCVLAGVEPAGWARQAAWRAGRERTVAASVGLHPHVVCHYDAAELEPGLEALHAAAVGDASLAIGELGLDSSRWVPRGSLPAQRHAFRLQLSLARELDRPVVLHVLDAHGHALDVLQRDGVPKSGGVVHSYSGAPDLVARYEALGLCLSFSGSITRPTARRTLEAAARVSPDRLLVETDCPDQRPSTRDGSRNLPEFLPDVVAAVAAARGASLAHVAALTTQNATRLFHLEPFA